MKGRMILAAAFVGLSLMMSTSIACATNYGRPAMMMPVGRPMNMMGSANILNRPNRPGHIVGNTIRNTYYGSSGFRGMRYGR